MMIIYNTADNRLSVNDQIINQFFIIQYKKKLFSSSMENTSSKAFTKPVVIWKKNNQRFSITIVL